MSSFLDGTGLSRLLGKIKDSFVAKSDTATVTSVSIDSTPTSSSSNLVTSGGVYNALSNKQATLVSGTSIKTINNTSLLGSGNINANKIPSGSVDSTSTSTVFTATVDGVTELADGVAVILSNGVVASASGCTLNVNGLGAKPIYRAQTLESVVTTHWAQAYTCLFVYNTRRVEGGCWDMFYDSNSTYGSYSWGLGYAVCTTAAATAAKTATISSYVLAVGGICVIKFNNACPANATLNIRTRGAKPIYLGTSKITADDIKAGDTVTLLYETTTVSTGVYRILYIDRWKTGASGGDVNVIETVKVNGTALTPDSNKAVDVTVPTALSSLSADATHRLVTDTEKSTWNGKQAALVSGTSIKTINNESLLGSGNISIDISGKEDALVITSASGTSLTAAVGKCYYFSSNVTSLNIIPPSVTGTKVQGFMVGFATGSSPSVTISTSKTIYYADGYVIEANTRYELDLLWNGSYWSLSYVKLGALS